MDAATHKFSMFNREEARAIVAYLRYKASKDKFDRIDVEEALQNYWLKKAGESAM